MNTYVSFATTTYASPIKPPGPGDLPWKNGPLRATPAMAGPSYRGMIWGVIGAIHRRARRPMPTMLWFASA